MRRTYLDTSALRHLLVAHPSTATVTAVVGEVNALIATSQVTVTELHRLGQRVTELSVQDVDAVLDQVDLVTLDAAQLRAAGLLPDLASGTQLRSLDALHIQAALDFGATAFLTSDSRQAQAAAAIGLDVQLLPA